MTFANRRDAAERLAEQLRRYKGTQPLVLGVPRGGAPMAWIIAEALDGDFDVVLVRKLRAPYQPELAIGSVDESGYGIVADWAEEVGANHDHVMEELRLQTEETQHRRRLYTPERGSIPIAGRTVIIVDDGVATGSTLLGAIKSVRAQEPERIVVAVGVASPEAVRKLKDEADEVVCALTASSFQAVGQFYEDFDPVTDEEVIEILQQQPVGHGASAGASIAVRKGPSFSGG